MAGSSSVLVLTRNAITHVFYNVKLYENFPCDTGDNLVGCDGGKLSDF
jgi:hypothetical protein